MELPKYTKKALKTAQPEAFSLEYLVPGIVGEVGELFGQQAKGYWHGWDEKKLQTELVSEYGDICWMTAILLHTQFVDNVALRTPYSTDGKVGQMQILSQATMLYNDYLGEHQEYLASDAAGLWNLLSFFSEPITGHTFSHVLKANLKKLEDRAARNVLRGSGDHR